MSAGSGLSLGLFITTFAAGAAVPGPSQAVLIAQVSAHGRRQALWFIVGSVAGTAIWLATAISGLWIAAAQEGPWFRLLKWAGILYLLYVAYRLMAEEPEARPPQSVGAGIATGLLVSLSNPKAVVFFAAILPQVVDLGRVGAGGYAVVMLTGVAVDLAVQLTVLFIADRACRSPLFEARRYWIAFASGMLMTAAATALAVQDLR